MSQRNKHVQISIPIDVKEVDLSRYIDITKYEMYYVKIVGIVDASGKDRKIPFGDCFHSSDDSVVSGKTISMGVTTSNTHHIFGKPKTTQLTFNIEVWWYKWLIFIEPSWEKIPVNIKNLNIVVYYKDKEEE